MALTGSIPVVQIEASLFEKNPDGSLGKSVQITNEIAIGREGCEISYPDDLLLSPRHASLRVCDDKLLLSDLATSNGTFVRQRQDIELVPGDVFLLGRQLFRFSVQSLAESRTANTPEGTAVWPGPARLHRGPVSAVLEHIRLSGEVIEQFKLEKPETTLGRTTGDLVFDYDPYMSGAHARIVVQPGRLILQDLRSRNGVYRRIRQEVELRDGDEFFIGEQLFHVRVKAPE